MRKTNLIPLHDRLLIEPQIESEQKTDSGIFIPIADSVLDDTQKGIVLACGNGKITEKGIIPMTVKVGDTVLYNKRQPMALTEKGITLLTLRESDIICIVNEK